MLYRGVVSFHFRGCRTGDNEDFDLFPPPADGAPETVRLRLRGSLDQDLQPVFRGGSVGKRACGQQGPELFVDKPGRLQLPSGVIGREHGAEPVPCPVRECVPGAQEQPPVGPDRINGTQWPELIPNEPGSCSFSMA